MLAQQGTGNYSIRSLAPQCPHRQRSAVYMYTLLPLQRRAMQSLPPVYMYMFRCLRGAWQIFFEIIGLDQIFLKIDKPSQLARNGACSSVL